MTVHAAKGLEFPAVFIMGLEEGVFPHLRSIGEPDEMEEERRLAYVAITRAQERLYLSHAWSRTLFGGTQYNPPSRFLDEIPARLVEAIEQQRASRGGRTYGSGGLRLAAGDGHRRQQGPHRRARPPRQRHGPGQARRRGARPEGRRRRRPRHLRRGRDPPHRGPGRQGRDRHPLPGRRREAAPAVVGADQEGVAAWRSRGRRPTEDWADAERLIRGYLAGLPFEVDFQARRPTSWPTCRSAYGPPDGARPPRPRRRWRGGRGRRREALRRARRRAQAHVPRPEHPGRRAWAGRWPWRPSTRPGRSATGGCSSTPSRGWRRHRHLRVARVRRDRRVPVQPDATTPATSPSTSTPGRAQEVVSTISTEALGAVRHRVGHAAEHPTGALHALVADDDQVGVDLVGHHQDARRPGRPG